MQATVYEPIVNFEDETTGLVAGRSTVRPDAVDAEFTAIALSIMQLCYNLSTIQRDDTELRDGIVKPASLAASVLAMIGSATGSKWNARGAWVTSTAYAQYDFVETGGASYLCLIAHTSGVFNTDKTAGKWMVVGPSLGAITAANVPFTPVGTIAASTAQAAIAEAAAEAVQVSNNGADFASVPAVRSNLAVPSKAEMQRQAPGYCQAAGTSDAITGAFTPAITSLALPLFLYVEAVAANTTATPTFAADATAAKTIVMGSNQPLVAGNIPGPNFVMVLAFDVSLDKYVLLNPAATSLSFLPLTGGALSGGLSVGNSSGVLQFPDGSAGVPGARVGSDSGTGIGSRGNNILYLMSNAADIGLVSATGLLVNGSITATGGFVGIAASQAEMEAASSTSVFASPGRVQYHPGVAKAWCVANVTGGVVVGHNVASVSDDGAGQITFTLTTAFSSASWCAHISPLSSTSGLNASPSAQTSSTVTAVSRVGVASPTDPTTWHFVGFGDQ